MLGTFDRTDKDLYSDPAGIIHRVVTGGEIAVVRSCGLLGRPDAPEDEGPRPGDLLLAIVPLTRSVMAALGLPPPAPQTA